MSHIKNMMYPGIITIDSVEDFMSEVNHFAQIHDVHIQVLNAEMVYGTLHIKSAISHAIRSYEEQRMATQSLAMEVLLYASGERQLTRAIPKMGVNEGKQSIIVIFLSDCQTDKDFDRLIKVFTKQFKMKKDDSVLTGSLDTLKQWDVSEAVISSLSPGQYEDVILEKVAFVDIIK